MVPIVIQFWDRHISIENALHYLVRSFEYSSEKHSTLPLYVKQDMFPLWACPKRASFTHNLDQEFLV